MSYTTSPLLTSTRYPVAFSKSGNSSARRPASTGTTTVCRRTMEDWACAVEHNAKMHAMTVICRNFIGNLLEFGDSQSRPGVYEVHQARMKINSRFGVELVADVSHADNQRRMLRIVFNLSPERGDVDIDGS